MAVLVYGCFYQATVAFTSGKCSRTSMSKHKLYLEFPLSTFVHMHRPKIRMKRSLIPILIACQSDIGVTGIIAMTSDIFLSPMIVHLGSAHLSKCLITMLKTFTEQIFP